MRPFLPFAFLCCCVGIEKYLMTSQSCQGSVLLGGRQSSDWVFLQFAFSFFLRYVVELSLLWAGKIHVEVARAVGANTASLSLYSTWLNTLKEQERASAFISLCWGPWAAQVSHQQPCSFAQSLLQNTEHGDSVELHCPLAWCLIWSSANWTPLPSEVRRQQQSMSGACQTI